MALLIRFLLSAALAVAVMGCVSTQSMVESRFAALHGCPAETVTRTASGWVATGCGVRAQFYCFDTDDDDFDSDEDTILGHLLFSSLAESGDDVCVQEQVDARPERVQVKDPTIVSKGADGTVRLKAYVPLLETPRGELLFSAAPGWKVPGIGIRMALELAQPLPEKCPTQVWIDGKAEAVRSERYGEAGVVMAISSDQLARMGQAQNLSLQACDHVATLPYSALSRVRLFASRFAETRSRVFTPNTNASAR